MSGPQNFVNKIRYCALSLLVLLSTSSGLTAPVEATNQDVPIQIRLKPDKKTLMLGEPLFFSFEVTNLSGERLCLALGADYRNKFGRPDSFRVTVSTEDGAELPQLEVISLGGFFHCPFIEPGATYTVRLFLSHWASIERPGSYRINVKRQTSFSGDEPSGLRTRKYSMLADVNAEFVVVPFEKNRMGEVISSLGSVMLDSSDPRAAESAQALASIEDDRVISYFAEALGKFSDSKSCCYNFNEDVIRSRSIAALGTYDDDRAIEPLQTAMNSSNEWTRQRVATAFGHSPHKSAFRLLLRMQDDSYWFVRHTVALRLATVKTIESRTVLHKLLQDENEEVRKASKESLNKLNQ